jgi:hypothetical protein
MVPFSIAACLEMCADVMTTHLLALVPMDVVVRLAAAMGNASANLTLLGQIAAKHGTVRTIAGVMVSAVPRLGFVFVIQSQLDRNAQ